MFHPVTKAWFLASCLLVVAVIGCADEDELPPCDEGAVHGVRVSTRGEPAVVCVGSVLQVAADRWACATHKEATSEMIWSAEPAAIATVEGGRVTGVSAGQVTIAATSGADRDSLTIEVRTCPDAGADSSLDSSLDSSGDAPSEDVEDASTDAAIDAFDDAAG